MCILLFLHVRDVKQLLLLIVYTMILRVDTQLKNSTMLNMVLFLSCVSTTTYTIVIVQLYNME